MVGLRFELTRLLKSKIIFAIILLIIIIGIAGVFLTHYYGGSRIEPSYLLAGIYNGYCQFSFIIFGALTAFLVANDKKRGITEFFTYLGFSRKKAISSKIIAIALAVVPLVSIIAVGVYLFFGIDNSILLISTETFLILSLITTILFGALVGLLSPSAVYAVISVFLSALLFSILNTFFGGVILQGDASSVSSYVVNSLAGDIPDVAPAQMFSPFLETHGFLLATSLSIGWICLLLIALSITLKNTNTK